MGSSIEQPGATYEIQVQGELDRDWQQYFNGLAVTLVHDRQQPVTTILTGPVADQAALRGVLCRLWDLNLALISVRRVQVGSKEEHENG